LGLKRRKLPEAVKIGFISFTPHQGTKFYGDENEKDEFGRT